MNIFLDKHQDSINFMIMEKKNYSNGEITVVWEPGKCIHSGICVRGLNAVFNTRVSPWINVQRSDSATIAAQVKKCPSGALSLKAE